MSDDGLRIYDRQGNRITLEEWSKLLGSDLYRRVAWTEIGDVKVSTVWLGLEHHLDLVTGTHPPAPVAIFETMVFGGVMDQEQWRYATEEQALEGHAHVVTLVKSQLSLEGLTEAAEPAPQPGITQARNAAAHQDESP